MKTKSKLKSITIEKTFFEAENQKIQKTKISKKILFLTQSTTVIFIIEPTLNKAPPLITKQIKKLLKKNKKTIK